MLPISARSRLALIGALTLLFGVVVSVTPALAAPQCFGQAATKVGTDDNDEIHGTDGDDVIVGLEGRDRILGGGGNDLICGGTEYDFIYGGAGNDSLDAGDSQGDAEDQNDAGGNLGGGTGDDLLNGSPDRDSLDGGKGNDRVFGRAGNDNLSGADGDDMLDGGTDDDDLDGDEGRDELRGDSGNDTLNGGPDNDDLDGGSDDTRDSAAQSGDTVSFSGARGDVDVDLGAGTSVHHPEAPRHKNDVVPDFGNDRLRDIENVFATSDGDRITGDEDANFIFAGFGGDTVSTKGGSDSVDARDGGDDISLGEGNDTLRDVTGGSANGGSGTDELDVNAFGPVVVNMPGESVLIGTQTEVQTVAFENASGGSGDDILLGDDGPNVLNGERGRDDLNGGKGNDIVNGNGQSDIVSGGDGDDIMDGGTQHDQAGYSSASQGVNVNLTTGVATGQGTDQLISLERIGGSGYDDTLIGNELRNRINGKTGHDVMQGLGGNDTIQTGFGDDVFDGGEGDDLLQARSATAGLTLNLGANTISGEGNDTITGIERVAGSLYDDTLIGNEEANTLRGRLGNDVIDGAGGDDWVIGAEGDDTLNGGAGADTIEDETGTDVVNGDAGNDLIYPWTTSENDSYSGGDDIDTLDFTRHASGIHFDAEAGTLRTQGTATVATIESVLGTAVGDTIRGDSATNIFDGGEGIDQLVGRGGDDELRGSGADDLLDGGDGIDTVVLDDAIKPVVADLFAGFSTGRGNDTLVAMENIIGSIWPDVLRGDPGPNVIQGGRGADTMEGFAGNDTIDGEDGNDFADGGSETDTCVAEKQENCEA